MKIVGANKSRCELNRVAIVQETRKRSTEILNPKCAKIVRELNRKKSWNKEIMQESVVRRQRRYPTTTFGYLSRARRRLKERKETLGNMN